MKKADRLPEWCLRLGILYLVCGMCVGAHMGMTENFQLRDVHAHLNLLGYASTFMTGLFLKLYPSALKSKLAVGSVLLILIAVPLTLTFLTFLSLGHMKFAPLLGMASTLVLVGYVLFAIAVFRATAK